MLEFFVLGMGFALGYLVAHETIGDYYRAEVERLEDALAEIESI